MTVQELCQRLQDLIDDGCGDAEVRLVYQRNYPLQDTVAGVAGFLDEADYDTGEADESVDPEIVYIVSGGQCHDDPYGPKWPFEVAY